MGEPITNGGFLPDWADRLLEPISDLFLNPAEQSAQAQKSAPEEDSAQDAYAANWPPWERISPTRGMSAVERLEYWDRVVKNSAKEVFLNPSSSGAAVQSLVHFFAKHPPHPATAFLFLRDVARAVQKAWSDPAKRDAFLENVKDFAIDYALLNFATLGNILSLMGGPSEKSSQEIQIGDKIFRYKVKDGALVVNGRKWKVEGSDFKTKSADIILQEAKYIPGEGLRLSFEVHLPEFLKSYVPSDLQDHVNNPDNPFVQTVPEDQLEPVLTELSSDKEIAEIPQLKDYPIQVVAV